MKKALFIISTLCSITNTTAQLTTVTFDTQTQNDLYQTFTVPCGVTSITINAVGASGGGTYSSPPPSCVNCLPGLGARMIGTFNVTPGQILRIRAGRYGLEATRIINGGVTNFYGGSGGGASWVYNASTNQPLIVAGGGGGVTCHLTDPAISKKGGDAIISNLGSTGGNSSGNSAGGGGGGWTTNGAGITGGKSYTNNGNGGGSSANPSFNYGGFGGGGGGSGFSSCGGGGGGGYSGGNGGYTIIGYPFVYSSSGGGSFNSGINQQNLIAQKGPIPPTYASQLSTKLWNGQVIISYFSPMDAPIIIGQSLVCNSSNSTLAVQNPISGCNYFWSNGSTGASINVTTSGSYSVYATSSCGNSQVSIPFSVNTYPVLQTSITPSGSLAICQGDSVQLIDNGTTGVTYQWKKDNLNIVGATNSSYFARNSGSYSVIISDNNGCSEISNTLNVDVKPLPSSVIVSNTTIYYCYGDIILNDLTVSQNQSYNWNTGENSQSITVSQAGTYSVIVTDANGCQNSDSVEITVNPLPTVNAGTDLTICQGESITLTASGANTYLWNNNVSNNIAFTPTNTCLYVVTGTDVNGCQDLDTVDVTINSLPLVFSGTDQTICQGHSVTLTATGASTYSWNNNVTNDVAFTPTSSNNYIVTGTDANNCQSSDTVYVTVNAASSSQLTQTALGSYILNGHTYTQSGTYTQVIPNAIGCDSTITLNLTISTSGLNELSNEAISIYPNPVSNQININYNGNIEKLEIIDVKGTVVFVSKENKKEYVLPANLQTGYYMVVIYDNNSEYRKELLINK